MRSLVKRAAAAVATAAALATRGTASAEPAAAAAAAAAGAADPWYYHGLDGPRFATLNTSAAYETRRVEGTTWVATTVTDASLMTALNTGFRKLFKYISGANADSAKIAMTVPVLTFVQPPAGPFCKTRFTVAFMAPHAVVAAGGPPAPTDASVFVKTTGAAEFYVASKGGWVMTDGAEAGMAAGLASALEAAGVEFADRVFLAGYDPPFRLINRHNEVWVPTSEAEFEAWWGKEEEEAGTAAAE